MFVAETSRIILEQKSRFDLMQAKEMSKQRTVNNVRTAVIIANVVGTDWYFL